MKDQEQNFAKAYKIYQARKETSKKKKQSKYDFSEVYSEILIFGWYLCRGMITVIILKLIYLTDSSHKRQKEEEQAMTRLKREERIEQIKHDIGTKE